MNKFSKLSAYMLNIKNANAMTAVKGAVPWLDGIISVFHIIKLPVTSSRVRSMVSLLRIFNFLYKTQGVKGLTLYLKVCAVMLQQALGGFIVKDLGKLGPRVSRTNKGLPRIINRIHRNLLLGDPRLIKLYLTVFNMYRVLDFKGEANLSTISDPMGKEPLKGSYVQTLLEMLAFMPLFFTMLRNNFGISIAGLRGSVLLGIKQLRLFPLLKSSPNTGKLSLDHGAVLVPDREGLVNLNDDGHPVTGISTHPLAVYNSLYSLFRDKELRPVANYFKSLIDVPNVIHEIIRRVLLLRRDESKLGLFPIWTRNLGKLSIKEEAAGKRRVFAMVDPFTQWVLKPLHDAIFYRVLAKIPQDGTFDQLAPVKVLMDAQTEGSKPKGLFSFDIKAATDRIPLELQQALIAYFMGETFASNWAKLLTSRTYWLKEPMVPSVPLRYGVGQPMGALSSWASLALVHHFIVQFSAYKAGASRWFTSYAVLGDDIVIGDPEVAREYLATMDRMGVVIGLPKSIISREGTALEFAKRTYYKGEDVSPVPFKEMAAAFKSPSALVTFTAKYNLSWLELVKALGFGYRVRGALSKPFANLNGKLRMITLAINTPLTVEDAKSFFELGAPKTFKGFSELKEVINELIGVEMIQMKRRLNALRLNGYTLEKVEWNARELAKVLMAQTNTAIVNENSRNPSGPMSLADWSFVLPLVRQIIYSIQIDSKSTLLMDLEEISRKLINLQLWGRDLEFFDLYMQFIELQKDLGKLPLASLGFIRLLENNQAGLTDTVHIRLWRRLAKYMFSNPGATVKYTGMSIATPMEIKIASAETQNAYAAKRAASFKRDLPPHLDGKPDPK